MVRFQAEEKAKLKRQRVEQAIKLAMENQWEKAAEVNRSIIDLFSGDVDAYNRLGKALTELGHYPEARDAYRKALEMDPMNRIAEKNLARLVNVDVKETKDKAHRQLDPRLFIEETGKTGFTSLVQPGPKGTLSRMAAGDEVFLVPEGRALVVQNAKGEHLGKVEPRLSQRLIDLMHGGNKYVAAVSTLGENQIAIFVRETLRHPSQAGRASFKPSEGTGVRPYIKAGMLQYDFEEDDEDDEGIEEDEATGEDGEEETVSPEVEIEPDESGA
ncbi:MAG: tetratricopeptide repeat protein [Chloroflexi bacterium]|nr:tetratricopeptide repeat protein [Chloroflexota bacterium]MCL5110535.1 tetratricopeptide repeat protein [Chloroflexota bacterium]